MSHDKVEVGVTLLNKTVNSSESPVAFMRVKDMATSIQEYLNKQYELGNIIEKDEFNNEIWIKIGVSRSGLSDTHVYTQHVNFMN